MLAILKTEWDRISAEANIILQTTKKQPMPIIIVKYLGKNDEVVERKVIADEYVYGKNGYAVTSFYLKDKLVCDIKYVINCRFVERR